MAFDRLQAGEIAVEEDVEDASLEVGEPGLVGEAVEGLPSDVEDEELVLTTAASAPLPCTGVASGNVNGDPKSHTGWAWPGDTTRELQQ